jgi:hypothetical protein
MQNGIVLVGDGYEHKVREVAKAIRTLFANVDNSALMLKERAYMTTRQQTLSSVNMQDPSLQLLYKVILDHCLKAEKAGPGSFLHVLDMVSAELLSPLPTKRPSFSELATGSYRPSWSETREYVSHVLHDAFLSELILQALELSGTEGRIFVERAASDVTSVEKLNGFTFQGTFPTQFVGTRQNVRCVIIDGFIETAAEVTRLFQHISDTKETLLLVCRGMADDVAHTIKVNGARKTLDVIPMTVRYDFEGLNVLNDIAIVCGADVVSSMKGQLISAIDGSELSLVQTVMSRDGTLTIVNDKAVSRARLQASQLMEKRSEVTLEQFQQIYDDRVKSLTSSSVRIRIAGDRNLSDYTEKLDVVLRVVRSTLRHGFFSGARVRTKHETLKRFADPVPFDTVVATMTYVESCLKALQNVSCIIV